MTIEIVLFHRQGGLVNYYSVREGERIWRVVNATASLRSHLELGNVNSKLGVFGKSQILLNKHNKLYSACNCLK